MTSLDDINKDCENILNVFTNIWDWHVFYKNGDNQTVYSSNIGQSCKMKRGEKKW